MNKMIGFVSALFVAFGSFACSAYSTVAARPSTVHTMLSHEMKECAELQARRDADIDGRKMMVLVVDAPSVYEQPPEGSLYVKRAIRMCDEDASFKCGNGKEYLMVHKFSSRVIINRDGVEEERRLLGGQCFSMVIRQDMQCGLHDYSFTNRIEVLYGDEEGNSLELTSVVLASEQRKTQGIMLSYKDESGKERSVAYPLPLSAQSRWELLKRGLPQDLVFSLK